MAVVVLVWVEAEGEVHVAEAVVWDLQSHSKAEVVEERCCLDWADSFRLK